MKNDMKKTTEQKHAAHDCRKENFTSIDVFVFMLDIA